MQTAGLPYGIYLGTNQIRHELPGFSVSLLTPAFRAEDVSLHDHEHASFVCVLSGAYRSSADNAAPISHAPTLIFNPAGTATATPFNERIDLLSTVEIRDTSVRQSAAH